MSPFLGVAPEPPSWAAPGMLFRHDSQAPLRGPGTGLLRPPRGGRLPNTRPQGVPADSLNPTATGRRKGRGDGHSEEEVERLKEKGTFSSTKKTRRMWRTGRSNNSLGCVGKSRWQVLVGSTKQEAWPPVRTRPLGATRAQTGKAPDLGPLRKGPPDPISQAGSDTQVNGKKMKWKKQSRNMTVTSVQRARLVTVGEQVA